MGLNMLLEIFYKATIVGLIHKGLLCKQYVKKPVSKHKLSKCLNNNKPLTPSSMV